MTAKTTGRTEATPKTSTFLYRTTVASTIKALIVGAACWGLLPVGLVEWIIRRLHLEAA